MAPEGLFNQLIILYQQAALHLLKMSYNAKVRDQIILDHPKS